MAVYIFRNCEMTSPYNSGKAFGEVSDEELKQMTVNLTTQQSMSPFAKYYFKPKESPDPDQLKAILSDEIAPGKCKMPIDCGQYLIHADGKENHNSYGVLPNGIGYASILIRQDGVTNEMVRKYREEFAHDPYLFYKVWFPGAHLLHYTDGAVEDFGYGMVNMHFDMEPFELSHIGITKEEVEKTDPHCLNIMGTSVDAHYLDRPGESEYLTMLQYTREVEGGRELYVIFWMGLEFDHNGKLKFKIPENRDYTRFMARCMMSHCIGEYQNQLGHMKQFWEESKH